MGAVVPSLHRQSTDSLIRTSTVRCVLLMYDTSVSPILNIIAPYTCTECKTIGEPIVVVSITLPLFQFTNVVIYVYSTYTYNI